MTMRRRHFSRIVLWQECVGNVLDLPPRYCLAASGPDVQEETFATAAGTEATTAREHVIEVPVSEEETARLAEIMEELSNVYGHRVGATLLGSQGAQHIQWAEATSLRVLPESRDFFGMAASVLRLKTSVFHASIGETTNLIEPVPWEGASTPGSASQIDGITTLAGSELAVYDDSEERVYLHTRWNEGTYRRFKTPQKFGPDVGMTAYVRGGDEEILMIDEGVDEIVRFDLTGTQLGVINPNNASGGALSPSGLTIANGDLVVIGTNDDLHIYDGVPDGSSNFVNATSSTSISSNTGKYISYDSSANLLFSIANTGSAREIRLHQGTSASITDTFSTQSRAGEHGLSAADEHLFLTDDVSVADYGETNATSVPTFEKASADITRRMPLRVRRSDGRPERGYYGPTWRAGHECRVDIDGVPDTVSVSDPIVLDYTLPIGTAEIELRNVTGELDGLAFNGTALGLSGGGVASPPRLLLEGGKYSGLGINASGVWAVRARLEDVAARPELVIYYPGAGVGDPRGALRGAYSEDCVSQVGWTGANVQAIAFDVDADAGDDLSIAVTDAAGNYIGQISGDGNAVKGTSATFTYENAGVFTAELVSEAFEGLTELDIRGPADVSTMDLTSLVDANRVVVSRRNNVFDQDPFGSAGPNFFPPNATELELRGDANIDLADAPDRYTELNLKNTPSIGDFGESPASAEILDYEGTDIAGQITSTNVPSALRALFCPPPGTGFEFAGNNGADGSQGLASEGNLEFLFINNPTEFRLDTILEGCDAFSRLKSKGFPGTDASAHGNLEGTDNNGDPFLTSSIEQLEATVNSLTGLPDVWDQASSLSKLNFARRYDPNEASPGTVQAYNSGEGISNSLQTAQAEANSSGTLASSQPTLNYFETYETDWDGDNGVEILAVSGSTIDQAMIDHALGLTGTLQGASLKDFGIPARHYTLVEVNVASDQTGLNSNQVRVRVQIGEIQFEPNRRSGTGEDAGGTGSLTTIDGARWQISAARDDGNGNVEQFWQSLFEQGQACRLLGGGDDVLFNLDINGTPDTVDTSSYSGPVDTVDCVLTTDGTDLQPLSDASKASVLTGVTWTPVPSA